MPTFPPLRFAFTLAMAWSTSISAIAGAPLPQTETLELTGDLAARMVSGIHQDVDQRTREVHRGRTARWTAMATDPAFFEAQRDQLRAILGAVDARAPLSMTTCATPGEEGPIARGPGYHVYAVRWSVFPGVTGAGLLVEPDGEARASVVLLPDADQDPWDLLVASNGNEVPYGADLAARGARILAPVLINRQDTHSGHPKVRMTNQPHREFIYRGAFEMGRHIIGYELQKVFAGIDWLKRESPDVPVGVAGYGEGGLIALHAAALDTRVQATVVSGHFGSREGLWEEPIYRNVWKLLTNFGDSELAAMIAPRALIVEPAKPPEVTGPPRTEGRPHGAAPGAVPTPTLAAIQAEIDRALVYAPNGKKPWLYRTGAHGGPVGQSDTLTMFADALKLPESPESGIAVEVLGARPDAAPRQERQFKELLGWTAHIMEEAPFARKALWEKADASSVETWVASTDWYRNHFHETVIGKLPAPTMDFNPRSRQVYDTDTYLGYEVVLDTYPDVFAYGILLVPKNIPAGEKRPVVVCQHGLEGRPQDLADPGNVHRAYEQYGCKLAERGFIVYAPQNPYIGGDDFRSVQRKANPLGLSLFSYIVAQHDQTLKWLATLPFVDPERIAFYGLSYGGKTAMRVPAILEDYCLSICSGDYNEWIWKNVTTRQIYSYMFHGEYEMFEWNMGNTYNYAEMSWLICPRPFMVERGHHDGVAPDEWVAYEYAKTQRRYDLLGIGDETAIEYFDGPHKIHGVGTFAFLHDQLDFPAPEDN